MNDIAEEKVRIEIIDLIGKVISNEEVTVTNGVLNHEAKIEEGHPSGTYLIRIITENNGVFVSKFVKM